VIDKRHWSNALAVQSACNLSGVVLSFAEAMKALCAECLDTDARNRHPIAVLFAAQVQHLTSHGNSIDYYHAYERAMVETGEI